MPNRYSLEEIGQIRDLAVQGLSNREIAQRLGRAEAGIRNIRHRLKVKTNTRNQLHSLLQEKTELEKKVQELRRSQAQETMQLSSLQKKRQETRAYLGLDQLTLQQKLQAALIQLKNQKPELFYLTGTEQITKLTTNILQWLLS